MELIIKLIMELIAFSCQMLIRNLEFIIYIKPIEVNIETIRHIKVIIKMSRHIEAINCIKVKIIKHIKVELFNFDIMAIYIIHIIMVGLEKYNFKQHYFKVMKFIKHIIFMEFPINIIEQAIKQAIK